MTQTALSIWTLQKIGKYCRKQLQKIRWKINRKFMKERGLKAVFQSIDLNAFLLAIIRCFCPVGGKSVNKELIPGMLCQSGIMFFSMVIFLIQSDTKILGNLLGAYSTAKIRGKIYILQERKRCVRELQLAKDFAQNSVPWVK